MEVREGKVEYIEKLIINDFVMRGHETSGGHQPESFSAELMGAKKGFSLSAEQFKGMQDIPAHIRPGTAEMVRYQIRNAMLKMREVVAREGKPSSQSTKLLMDKLEIETVMMQKMRGEVVGTIAQELERAKKSVVQGEPMIMLADAFPAGKMHELVQRHFVDRYEEEVEKGRGSMKQPFHTPSVGGPNRVPDHLGQVYMADELLGAAKDLLSRLADEAGKAER